MGTQRKPKNVCKNCDKFTNRRSDTYCSNTCQADYQHKSYIQSWKNGETLGLQRLGVVSNYIKNYLRGKYDNKCLLCGWSEINAITGKVPLVADHIDGNWRNNVENNLRLICPNCDSLTATYSALNIGSGRDNRQVSKRVIEARKLVGYSNALDRTVSTESLE
jgi:predicted restriction endonuclease